MSKIIIFFRFILLIILFHDGIIEEIVDAKHDLLKCLIHSLEIHRFTMILDCLLTRAILLWY